MVRELSSPQRQIFQLKISLSDVTPVVWRRVLVPGGYTLDRLHRVFQHVMGWQDCHLHSFEIDGLQYGEPDPDGELTLRDELDTRLDAVIGKGSRFRYTYDFGDWWEHDVTVEDAFGADPGSGTRSASPVPAPARRRMSAGRSATAPFWSRSPTRSIRTTSRCGSGSGGRSTRRRSRPTGSRR